MNRPIAQIVQLWDALYQNRELKIPKNASNKELQRMMQEIHERGQYITWLTHGGPTGSWGMCDYINSLAGM
jgi:hypothetical protein